MTSKIFQIPLADNLEIQGKKMSQIEIYQCAKRYRNKIPWNRPSAKFRLKAQKSPSNE